MAIHPRARPRSPARSGHPLDGPWSGYRIHEDAGHEPMRLKLRCRDGAVAGRGDGPGGRFDVFGLYGARTGRVALLLTSADGCATDLEGERRGPRIVGTWLDEAGETGDFAMWPAGRAPGATRR